MLGKLLLTLALLIVCGRAIRSFTVWNHSTGHKALFIDLSLGLYLGVSIYAVLVTKGVSISTVLLIWMTLFCVLTRALRKPSMDAFRIWSWKPALELAVVAVILYLLNFIRYHDGDYSAPIVVNMDGLWDVSRAICMNHTGTESVNTNFIQPQYGTEPYHYTEAWAVAMLATLTGSNYWLTQCLVFQPIMLCIVYAGFRAFQLVARLGGLSILFACSSFFASGVLTSYVLPFPFFQWTDPMRSNIMDEYWWSRLVVLYPFAIAALHLYASPKTLSAIMILLAIPFISVTPAIPVISTIFFILIIRSIVLRRGITPLLWLLLPVGAATLYYGFHILFRSPSTLLETPSIERILFENRGLSALRIFIVTGAERIIQTIVGYSPLLILAISTANLGKTSPGVRLGRPDSRHLWLFVVTLGLVALALAQTLRFLFGASFFYWYSLIPFVNVLLVWLCLRNVGYLHGIKKITFMFMYCALFGFWAYRSAQLHGGNKQQYFIDKYHPSFIQSVAAYCDSTLGSQSPVLGIKVEAHEEIAHPFYNDGLSLCGYYLYGILKAPVLVSVSRADMPEEQLKEEEHYERFTKETAFYKFVEERGLLGNSPLLDSLKLIFVKEHSFRFGVVSPLGQIPKSLHAVIDTVISDPKSGERFISFKY